MGRSLARTMTLSLVCLAVTLACNDVSPAQETGIASYVSNKLHGCRTASGETYDRNKLTAAHRSYPLGSLVRVTNLRNGKTVTLRVNDRGPFVRGRSMDVSHRAAKLLGFVRQGVTRVKMEVIRRGH